ncbi:MAG: hypothetical protein JW818_14695 [Pirellulales bacterium]|nr:hypothetical protein [Pirellulales bacterium]
MKSDISLIVGVVVLFATIALNRFFTERNYGSLAQEDKLKLTDAFSRHRSFATYVPIGIMLAVIAIGYMNPPSFFIAFPIGVVLVLLVSFAVQVAICRRLTELSLPVEYVARHKVQSTLVQIGNVVALSMFAYGIFVGFG